VQQAALVALDGEGRVRAMIGGVDYADSQFNRAVEAKRQAGSAFKPFVYIAAMETGRTPDLVVADRPIKIGNWEPRNYTGSFLGDISMETAVAQSVNTVAAKVADEVGRDNVARVARRMGIKSEIQTGPSMALGAVEVSPLEMAQAYAPLSNGGLYAAPYGIERIRTRGGEILYERRNEGRAPVLSNPALSHMNRMLRAVVLRGTGTRAAVPGYDLAGKTGTTSDYKDAWFVGYTGGFTTAVWVGRDNNKPMKRVTGGSAPADIWRSFMTAALPRLAVRPIPEGPMAMPVPVYEDSIGQLLETANEFFEGTSRATSSFRKVSCRRMRPRACRLPQRPRPLPIRSRSRRRHGPTPGPPMRRSPIARPLPYAVPAQPYRGQPVNQSAPPPSGPRQPTVDDYVAAGAVG
jgi:penicillin-binding protein 1A